MSNNSILSESQIEIILVQATTKLTNN